MPLLVFDTTHHAVWAERVILDAGCAALIQPAPERARALCNLAVEYLDSEEARVLQALNAAGAPYRVFDRISG